MGNSATTGFADRSTPTTAYDADFYLWTQEQARVLRELRPYGVDWENAAEEIESVGRSQKTEIRNRLIVLLMHLLKWQFQPEKRKDGWLSTIGEQRVSIEGLLETSPSLRAFPGDILEWAYERARRRATQETRLSPSTFPEHPPFTIAEVLDDAFMPGEPWHPDDLAE
ncbi:MAG: DUF29 domain-containing protein [Bauldia sp.]|nr:DUF29 domain-containing protein [Bauldia sp.]